MKKLLLLVVLLVVTGCSSHSNLTGDPAKTAKHSSKGTKAPAANITQASSVANSSAKQSKVSIKQTGRIKSKWTSDDLSSAEYPEDQAQTSIHYDQDVLKLVNDERAKAGLSALVMDDSLSKMALVKAQDLYNNHYFDHNSPTYGSPFDMMRKFQIDYNAAGENIAQGQPTPTKVMNDWMNSAGHRANIMNTSFTKIGIAYFKSTWVQEFTG